MTRITLLATTALGSMLMSQAMATTTPYTYLDSAYTASIYETGTTGSIGLAFDAAGHMVRPDGSGGLYVGSLTADTTVNGTSVHSATYQYTGIGGYGITYRPQDGFLYSQNFGGQIGKINPTTYAATTLAGTSSYYYGMHTTPTGNLVFGQGSVLEQYNFATSTQSTLYNSGSFIDDVAVAPTGEIFVAVLGASRIDIVSSTGTLINSFTSPNGHLSDGLAYGNGAIYGNNTDGTITKITFSGSGFTGTATETLIASGGGYGDNATVGPDGAFYVTNSGVHYDDGSTGPGGYSVVRIAFADTSNSFADGTTSDVPEPASLAILGVSMIGVAAARRRKRT